MVVTVKEKDWWIVGAIVLLILLLNWRRVSSVIGGGANGSGAGGGTGGGGCGCSGGCGYGASTAGNPVSAALPIGDYGQGGFSAAQSFPSSRDDFASELHYGTTIPIVGPTGDYTQGMGGDGIWP